MTLHSPREKVDPAAQTQVQRDIQQMLVRAQEQLLQETEEELPEEEEIMKEDDGAESNEEVSDGGRQETATSQGGGMGGRGKGISSTGGGRDSTGGGRYTTGGGRDSTGGGRYSTGGGSDSTGEGLMTSGGRNSDARIRRTTRREPPPVADGDGAHDHVTITISETELDTFDGSHTSRRTTLEKGFGLKAPQDSAHSRPPRATSLNHSGDHNARLGSRDRVGKSVFIGGRHKPHVAGHFGKDHPNRAGTVRIRMDKKRQSAELDLEDQDDETDEVIPLGRKRATIHLAHGALHRPSQSNGPGNGAVLSADTIASHLASEFSLSPMRIDSIVSDVSGNTLTLASFWPKPTRLVECGLTALSTKILKGDQIKIYEFTKILVVRFSSNFESAVELQGTK